MGSTFASARSILLRLFLLLCVQGIAAREIDEKHSEDMRNLRAGHYVNVLRIEGVSADGTKNDKANPSSHMHQMNSATAMVFFTIKDLKVGKTMSLDFPKIDFLSAPPLLPKEEADLIPFSYKKLTYLLKLFNYPRGSPQATAMEFALKLCGSKPGHGETSFCATSLESLLASVREIFGLESHFKALTTNHLSNSETILQNYSIQESPMQISAPEIVACHTLAYPYVVFYCHSQKGGNEVFEVSLAGENGDLVEATAVCHMDTSRWDSDHVAFRVLGIEPGSSEVCHFVPTENIVWVPV